MLNLMQNGFVKLASHLQAHCQSPTSPRSNQNFVKELANFKGRILKFFSLAPSQENFYYTTNSKKIIYQDSFLVPRQINKACP